MADAKDQDQSMEEILQSIKRIIADEGDPAPAPATEVLELTDMLAEEEAAPAPTIPTMSIDEIMAAPVSSVPAEPEFVPTPEPVAPAPAPAAVAPVVDEEALISDATRAASAAALDALRHTHAPAPAPVMSHSFRSGDTVEDLVIEFLRPMLKEWLDANLTTMVERLVEKEVRRISSGQ